MVDISQQVDLILPPQRRPHGPSEPMASRPGVFKPHLSPHQVKAMFMFMALASLSPQWLISGILSSQGGHGQAGTALMEPRSLLVPPGKLTQDASGHQAAKLLHGSNGLGQFLLGL